MKQLYDSYKSIFDKANVNAISKDWTVNESDAQSSFKALKITGIEEGSYSVANEVYKCTHGKIFYYSSTLQDDDCDGFAFIQENGNKYIVLVELKSNFDSTKIAKAYKQIIFTFIKNHMTMSICNNYDIDNYSVVAVIACLPPNKEREGWLKDQMMLEQSRNNNDIRLTIKLFDKKSIKTTIEKISIFKGCNLSKALRDIPVTIKLINPSDNSSEMEISVKEIIGEPL